MHAPYRSDKESHLQTPNTTSAGHRGADSDEIIAAVAVPGDMGFGHTSHDSTVGSRSVPNSTPTRSEASPDRVPDQLLEDIALFLPRERAGMTTSLRSRLAEPGALVALGAHDGLTARIAERAGVEAVYHGGYALAAHHFALPDVGLVGRAEVVESVRRMRAATELPIIVDADTGYGSEASVWLTTRELEAAGANAVQIEDQVSPKRCGHMEGKEVIPAAEMTLKVRAAVAARRSDETLIIARTDALQVTGLDDAISRCNAYAGAGADLVFVDAPRTREEYAAIGERCSVPGVANMSETGRSPAIPTSDLEAMGYALVIFPSTQTWLFAKAYAELCDAVVRDRTTASLADRFMSFDDVNDLLGLAEWRSR